MGNQIDEVCQALIDKLDPFFKGGGAETHVLTARQAFGPTLAEKLFDADWPDSKDRWEIHNKNGPDAAARRYIGLAEVARHHFTGVMTEMLK